MAYNLLETEHQSRIRHVWRTYLSRYMTDFKKLDKIDQLEKVKGCELRAASWGPLQMKIYLKTLMMKMQPIPLSRRAGEIIQLASIHWHSLSDKIWGGWKFCAAKLNQRNLPGSFDIVPVQFRTNTTSAEEALKSLISECPNIAFNFQQLIVNDPRRELSIMSYVFGKERVPLLSKTYSAFHTTDLLRSSIWSRQISFKTDEKHPKATTSYLHILRLKIVSLKLCLIILYVLQRFIKVFTCIHVQVRFMLDIVG